MRYATGENQTWGFNVLRNIRHKNEQVYLAEIPRGFDIYRISLAAKVPGLTLPDRRDIKVIPYVLGSSNKDFTRATDQVDNTANVAAAAAVGAAIAARAQAAGVTEAYFDRGGFLFHGKVKAVADAAREAGLKI